MWQGVCAQRPTYQYRNKLSIKVGVRKMGITYRVKQIRTIRSAEHELTVPIKY